MYVPHLYCILSNKLIKEMTPMHYINVCSVYWHTSFTLYCTSTWFHTRWKNVYQHLSVWSLPSVLWRCWLGGRKGIRPVKNWVVWYWRGYLSGARLQDADLHIAQLMPLPLTFSCFSKIQIGFTFLVPAHPGSPRQRPLNGCVCVCTELHLHMALWF